MKAIVPLLAIIMSLFAPKAIPAADMALPHDLGAADRAAIELVIRQQLIAFRTDDAEAAFEQTSPRIRQKFGTPAAFLALVRSKYAALYRPRSVEFGVLTGSEPGGPVQCVFVVGSDNRPSVALYRMELQPDGQWKISGCYLTTADADVEAA